MAQQPIYLPPSFNEFTLKPLRLYSLGSTSDMDGTNDQPSPFLISHRSRSTTQLLVPIEICEKIIDRVAGAKFLHLISSLATSEIYTLRKDALITLASCALTCKSWLPRSRYHLYTLHFLCGDRSSKLFGENIRTNETMAFEWRLYSLTIITGISQWSRQSVPPLNPGKDVYDRRPFHLVPLILFDIPIHTLGVDAIRFIAPPHGSSPSIKKAPDDTICHHTFLRRYPCYKNLYSLDLYSFLFSSFSFLARLLLCFPSLKRLTLSDTHCDKLDRHPPNIARRRGLKLQSLGIWRGANYLSVLSSWLAESGAANSLTELTFTEEDQTSHVAVPAERTETLEYLNTILVAAGFSLRSVSIWLKKAQILNPILSFRRNSNLRKLLLSGMDLNYTVDIVSTIHSLKLSELDLSSDVWDIARARDHLEKLSDILALAWDPRMVTMHLRIRVVWKEGMTEGERNARREELFEDVKGWHDGIQRFSGVSRKGVKIAIAVEGSSKLEDIIL